MSSKNTELLIEFDEQGNVNLEVLNGDGVSCKALTKPLEDALGNVEENTRKYKPEYKQNQHNKTTQKQQKRLTN